MPIWSIVRADLLEIRPDLRTTVSCCRVMLELLADIRGENTQAIAEAAFANATKLFCFAAQ